MFYAKNTTNKKFLFYDCNFSQIQLKIAISVRNYQPRYWKNSLN